MTISQLIKDWTPEQSKILRDYVRAQGVPRTSYYQLIAQPLGQMRLEIAAIFARFIGCPLEVMPHLVKLDAMEFTGTFCNSLEISWYIENNCNRFTSALIDFDASGVLAIHSKKELTVSGQYVKL